MSYDLGKMQGLRDRAALEMLISEVGPGWTVDVIDHDYGPDTRYGCKVHRVLLSGGWEIRPSRPWRSQGRRYDYMHVSTEGDVITEGATIIRYITPEKHTGKPRRATKTFVFHPPS